MTRLISLMIAMLLGVCLSVLAQDEDAGAVQMPQSAKARKELAAVPEILSKGTYLTRKKPNLKAKYYGFIRSASWCVPCRIFVPQLLGDYRKMKGVKLELVLLGQEEEPVVKNYMKEHKYNIPGVMPDKLGSIPGVKYPDLGFPSLCIVDADGNFVAASGGTNMMEWRKQIRAYEAEQKKIRRREKLEAMKETADD